MNIIANIHPKYSLQQLLYCIIISNPFVDLQHRRIWKWKRLLRLVTNSGFNSSCFYRRAYSNNIHKFHLFFAGRSGFFCFLHLLGKWKGNQWKSFSVTSNVRAKRNKENETQRQFPQFYTAHTHIHKGRLTVWRQAFFNWNSHASVVWLSDFSMIVCRIANTRDLMSTAICMCACEWR